MTETKQPYDALSTEENGLSKKRVGRPRSTKPKAQDYKVSMTPEQIKEIDIEAKKVKMGRSRFFRFLLKFYLEHKAVSK